MKSSTYGPDIIKIIPYFALLMLNNSSTFDITLTCFKNAISHDSKTTRILNYLTIIDQFLSGRSHPSFWI